MDSLEYHRCSGELPSNTTWTQKDLLGENKFGVKPGADVVLKWLARDGIALKKGASALLPAEGGGFRRGSLEFRLTDAPEDVTTIPITM